MPGDFEQVLLKRRWAGHQLSALDVAIADYVDLEPYVAVIEDQPEAEQYIIRAHLRYPPLPTISHIVGDVLNNLHGVLDHLSWQLVLREGRTPGVRTEFPIQMPNEDGSEPWVNLRDARRRDAINDETVLDLLKGVQPYQNGPHADTHPLEVLRRLNRESKHRHLSVLASTARPPGLQVGGDMVVQQVGERTLSFGSLHRRLKDGDEIAPVLYAWLSEAESPEKPKLTTEVSLEDVARHPASGEPLSLMNAMVSIATFIDLYVLNPASELSWG